VQSTKRYEVGQILCRGTTPLLEAFDGVLGRRVIVRTLARPLAANPEWRSRFFDAAILAARLSCPTIAQVLDVGDEGGAPYVAMEFPAGSSLRSLMDEPLRRNPEFRVGIVEQLAMALAHAHGRGVLQLGLRPAGIFAGDAGQVSVIPFGTIPIHGSGGTLAALSLDEVAYLAPELVEGRVADRRADIFSLGVIGYELFAGRRPFSATNIPALLHELLSARIPVEALEQTSHSPLLESIILKALARDPDQRYAAAEALQQDLEGLVYETSSPEPQGVEASGPDEAAPASREPDAEELRAQALSCAVDGRFGEAMALAERLRARDPNDPRNALLRSYLSEEQETEALLEGAQHLVQEGDLREARALAARALSLDPTRPRALTLVRELDRVLIERRVAAGEFGPRTQSRTL
jgi:serine/threonine protein kinase